jgi:hypothetical protein
MLFFDRRMMFKKVFFLSAILGILFMFQNCTPQFSTLSSSSTINQSLSDITDSFASMRSQLSAVPTSSSDKYGLKGDCITDDTIALRSFFKVGGRLKKPFGKCYLVSDTIEIPSNIIVEGEGPETLIKMHVPYGSTARPTLNLAGSGSRTTSNIRLSKFAVDGGGANMTKLPEKYNGNIGFGVAILVQSSNTIISDITVTNGWDCGVGFYQLGCIDGGEGQQCNGYPKNVVAERITCRTNGIGENSKQLGSCVDALTSQNTLVQDSVDYGSATGFIADFGGNATGVFRNLKTYDNIKYGYWIGTSSVVFENIESHRSLGHGLVLDVYASGIGAVGAVPTVGRINGFTAIAPSKSGMLLAASGWEIKDAKVIAANQSNSNYSAFFASAQAASIPGLPKALTNTKLIRPIAINDSKFSAKHLYGFDLERLDPAIKCIAIEFEGANLSGAMGAMSPQSNSFPCQTTSDVQVHSQYRDWVILMFKTILLRTDAELILNPPGIEYYTSVLMNGSTKESVVAELKASDEYFVKHLFLDILQRPGRKEGIAYYMNELKTGAASRQALTDWFKHLCATHHNNECL